MKTYKDYGAPTETTPGNAGDLYVDLTTGDVYECEGDQTEGKDQGFVTVYAKDITNTKYSWKLKSGAGGDHECTGVSSWNDLLDRPFYEYEEEYTVESTETVTEEMTVEFDGVLDDEDAILVTEQIIDPEQGISLVGYLIRVSDGVIPSIEGVAGAKATIGATTAEQVEELDFDDPQALEADTGTIIVGPASTHTYIYSVPSDNMTVTQSGQTLNFQKKGLYFMYMGRKKNGEVLAAMFATKYVGPLIYDKTITETKTRTVIETIDHKFLPYGSDEYEEIHYEEVSKEVTEEMTIEHDGTIDENAVLIAEMPMEDRTMAAYFVRVSDATISTKEDAVGATFATMDLDGTLIESAIPEEGVTVTELEGGTIIACGVSADEQALCSVSADNLTFTTVGGQSATFPKKGLYFMVMTMTTNGETASGGVAKYVGNLHHTVTETITHSETKIKPIDPKFLPEPLAYEKSETVTKTELTTINLDDISDRVVATGATIFEMPMDYILFSEGVIATVEDVATMDGNIFADGQDNSINSMASAIEPVVGEKYISIGGGFVVSVFEDNTTVEIGDGNPYTPLGTVTFPKKGVYCMYIAVEGTPVMYTTSLTANLTFTVTKTDLKQIDPKFLPEHTTTWDKIEDAPFGETTVEVTEEMTIEWDGVIGDRVCVETTTAQGKTEYYVHVSDLVSPSKQSWIGMNIGYVSNANSEDVSVEEQRILEPGEAGSLNFAIHNAYVIQIQADNTTLDFNSVDMTLGVLTFPKKGIYFMSVPDMNIHVSSCDIPHTVDKTEVKTLDPKYLPDTIAPKELILTSSTEGSTKQFKITVADDGTLTAVEVTA